MASQKKRTISATQLYDYVQCPHRLALDVFGDTSLRDKVNPFVQLLWEQGLAHEAEIVASLPSISNIRHLSAKDREQETLTAMKSGVKLIYGGRLTSGDLVGEPDLLQRHNNGYIPGDIKSGAGFEGEENDAKLKKHYAYQLAHYVYILDELGFGDGSREAFVIDRNGNHVPYILTEPQGVRNTESWWDSYLNALSDVRTILSEIEATRGALCANCKLCHWYSFCKKSMISQDDLTLIAELGRA
jgi:predicted RecB family nuclease